MPKVMERVGGAGGYRCAYSHHSSRVKKGFVMVALRCIHDVSITKQSCERCAKWAVRKYGTRGIVPRVTTLMKPKGRLTVKPSYKSRKR